MSTHLALDIGGTKISAALVELPGDGAPPVVRGLTTGPTPAADGADAVLAAAVRLARSALTASAAERGAAADSPRPIDSIGVASAGVIDLEHGTVLAATDSLPGWTGTDIAGRLRADLGAPAHVLNDVHAHGLGEALFGTGAAHPSLLLLAVGTGIGGALVEDGEIRTGARGVAGHVGHIPCPGADGVLCPCGRSGHLEGWASGPGILARYRREGGSALSTAEIAQQAEHGSALARTVLEDAGLATGRALGGLLNVLDPAVVAVTGGVSGAGSLWWDALLDGVGRDAMDAVAATPVVLAQAGTSAALLGAAAHAARRTQA